jgi:xanthine dehydrogenase accessory factor
MVDSSTPDSATGGGPEHEYAALARLLARGERVAVCTIVRVIGSGPRRAGAKLLVRESGEEIGTIGGGALEAQAAAWGREILAAGGAACHSFVLSNADASAEGMTCGGEMELLAECVDGGRPGVADFFAQAERLLAAGARGCLAVGMRGAGRAVATARTLVSGGRLVAALFTEPCEVPEGILQATPHAPVLIEHGPWRYFLEPLAPALSLIVCGAGHIAAQLVPLCRQLGFRITVVDDRPEFANPIRFPLADRLVVAPAMDQALDGIDLGPNTYLVIVTRGHASDLAVARQALGGRPGYIGMIGSRRKRGVIFEALRKDGHSAEELSRIVCPIGLSINAETPEEIAVSIAAQLIARRALRSRRS